MLSSDRLDTHCHTVWIQITKGALPIHQGSLSLQENPFPTDMRGFLHTLFTISSVEAQS